MPGSFVLKEGLLGRVAVDGAAMIVDDIPDSYLTIGSALGPLLGGVLLSLWKTRDQASARSQV